MSAILESILPSKPSADEIIASAPLRAKVRESVLKRYDIFEKELPTYYEAGLTYWQIRPLKNFLESEIAWWNANIELTVQQVNTRKTSYVEQLQPLNKELTNNLKKLIEAMPVEKSKAIIDKLSANTTEGFADLPAKPQDTIDLTGATKSIDLTSIKETVSSKTAAAEAEAAKPVKETTWADDISSALKLALQIIGIILYICVAVRIAAFVANDLLYKPVPYRALGFIYAFIFAPILIPYYIYREFAHWIWPTMEAPHFESIFPVNPYDPSEPITFNKRVFGYADTPEIRSWIQKMQEQELGNHIRMASHKPLLTNLIGYK